MNAYHIVYSIRKDHCCPPSSDREVNERIVLAENEVLAIAQLTGNEIEIKNIELAD